MSAEFEPSPLSALQRERMATCLLESMPSEDEIRRAQRRFVKARAIPRRQRKALLVALAYGVVLGLASAAAAAFVADHVVLTRPPAAAPPEKLRALAPARAVRGHERRAPAPDIARAAAPPPTVAFPALPLPVQPVRAPALPARAAVAAREAPSPERAGLAARPTGSSIAVLPPVPVAAAPAGPWERAAKALAAGNWDGADKALNELDRSGDGHARDAAALARAQLWIANGRGAEARPILERLASDGATPLIRRRAGALLQDP